LNDKPEQEEFPALIDQSFILNDSPSMTHNVLNPSQFDFSEHAESQFDIDNLVFDDYFSVSELNVSVTYHSLVLHNLKFLNLDAHMLITKNTKCVEHNEFSDLHEEITSKEQPITMHK
jgi:hypothetical protein